MLPLHYFLITVKYAFPFPSTVGHKSCTSEHRNLLCVYLLLRIEHANGVRFSFIASHFCRRPLRAVEAEMPQIMFHMTNRTNVLLVTLHEGNPLMKSQAQYRPYMDVPRPVAAATNSGCKKSANFKVNNRQTRRLVFAPPRAQGSEIEGGGPGKCV